MGELVRKAHLLPSVVPMLYLFAGVAASPQRCLQRLPEPQCRRMDRSIEVHLVHRLWRRAIGVDGNEPDGLPLYGHSAHDAIAYDLHHFGRYSVAIEFDTSMAVAAET